MTSPQKTMIRCLLLTAAWLTAGCGASDHLPDLGGRMADQVSVQTFEDGAQPPPEGTVPIHGGEIQYRSAPEGSLKNPVPFTVDALERGRAGYGFYCVQCHGTAFDGEGTVGQSFAPLPSDLRSPEVQSLSDDRLFRTISFGSGRCPPLHATITVNDRWRIVHFLRSLKK